MGLSSLVCGTELCVSDMMRMRVLMVAEEDEEGGDRAGIGMMEETSSRLVVVYTGVFSRNDVLAGVGDDGNVESLLCR